MENDGIVIGTWHGYDGTFNGPAPTKKNDTEDRDKKIRESRSEIERLWAAAHPSEPFPYEIYGYDW